MPGYSPYDNNGYSGRLNPAIGETFNSILQESNYWYKGKKTPLEATGDLAKDNIMLYKRIKDYLERTDNPLRDAKLNGDRININKLEREWAKHKGEIFGGDKEKTQRQLMYAALRDNFYLGTKKEFHESLLATAKELTTQIYGDNRGTYPESVKDEAIIQDSWKKAWSLLFSQAKGWNPYTYNFDKDNAAGQLNAAKFFIYTARVKDDATKEWLFAGGKNKNGEPIPNPMTEKQLRLWNELHDSQKRFQDRLVKYADFNEIIEYHNATDKDPALSMKNMMKKKSEQYKLWEELLKLIP